MMMNNRLNKLTDSLESQLNYFSRQKGKPTKHKKHRGSPLLPEHPKAPLLITSRIQSRPSTPRFHSQSNSILWQEEQEEEDSEQLLVLNSASSEEILIMDEEEVEKQEIVEQQPQSQNSGRELSLQKIQSPRPQAQRSSSQESSPIFILEEGEESDLLWIDNEVLLGEDLQKSRNSAEIKIEEEDEEDMPYNYEQQVYNSQSGSRLLSQIQEMESHQQEDLESLYNGLTTSRIPISPQTTQPFFQLHKVETRPAQAAEHIWITNDRLDKTTSLEQSPEAREMSPQSKELSSEERRKSPSALSKGSSKNKRIVDRVAIRKALKQSPAIPFESSLDKTKILKEEILPKRLRSIQQMKVLIKNESQFVSSKLSEQRGTIYLLKKLLSLKVKVGKELNPSELYTFSQEQQIELNQLLLQFLWRRLNQ